MSRALQAMYLILDNYWKSEYDHVPADTISSYIHNSIGGYKENEPVSIFLGACYSTLTVGEDEPKIVSSALAWDEELNYGF